MYKKIFLTLLISVAAFASSNNQSISDSGVPCCLKAELASRVHDREWLDIPMDKIFAGLTVEVKPRIEIRRQFNFEYTVGKFVLNCRTADDSETQEIKEYSKKLAHPGCCIAAVLTLLRFREPAAPLICPNENILADFFNKRGRVGSRYCALYIKQKNGEDEYYTVAEYEDCSQATQPTDASQAGTSNQAGAPNIDN